MDAAMWYQDNYRSSPQKTTKDGAPTGIAANPDNMEVESDVEMAPDPGPGRRIRQSALQRGRHEEFLNPVTIDSHSPRGACGKNLSRT